MTVSHILKQGCPCGREHSCDVKQVLVGKGVLQSLPRELNALGVTKPFLLCDGNTYRAAGARVEALLSANGIPYVRWKYGQEQLIRQLLRPALEKMFPGIRVR